MKCDGGVITNLAKMVSSIQPAATGYFEVDFLKDLKNLNPSNCEKCMQSTCVISTKKYVLYVGLRFGASGRAKYRRRVSHLVPIGTFDF